MKVFSITELVQREVIFEQGGLVEWKSNPHWPSSFQVPPHHKHPFLTQLSGSNIETQSNKELMHNPSPCKETVMGWTLLAACRNTTACIKLKPFIS